MKKNHQKILKISRFSNKIRKLGEIRVNSENTWTFVNSLGNHTVNNLHHFLVVFVDFDREDVNFHEFWQNVLSQARSSAFFMYIIFFLEIKSSWINLGFSVENVVENVVIQRKGVWIEYFTLVFDDIFDRKSKIYPWWLDFQKKHDIHEKCGRASLTQNILAKFVEIYVFPVKIYKNHKKNVQIIYCVVSYGIDECPGIFRICSNFP